MDDQIAISRLKQGDLSGLETLVNRYQAQAVHAAYAIVFDYALADDIAQMAFVKVAERIHQFDQGYPFAPWFFRIVMNDAVKIARKRNHSVSLDDKADEPTSKLARFLIDPNPGPVEAVEAKEMQAIVLQAVRHLTPEQRAVVVMRYYLEMSESEMSAKMERPRSTVKWWLREARKRLRHLIAASRSLEEDE
jgi:RNA polymerase sigma-70 factor (ECF subfamily)